MAGSGQMSPRQKMINMMYLVYLAFLALNVSVEVLAAFETMREKLADSAGNFNQNNAAYVENMKAKIQDEIENEKKTANEGLLDTLGEVRSRTAQLIALLDEHSNTLRDSISGVDEETGELKAPDQLENNLQYWMGRGPEQEKNDRRGSGEAYKLHQAYDQFVYYIADLYNSQVKDPSNQLDADEYIIKDPEKTLDGEAKTWETFTFEGPLIANMAILEAMKLDVYELEKMLLERFNERLGVAAFKADSLVPILAPVSNVVPAGLQYESRVIVAMSSSQIVPTFKPSVGSVKTEPGSSVGTLVIDANERVIPKGKNEGIQKYSVSIEVPTTSGRIEKLTKEGEFTVRRPEIVITSAAVQNLYRECANDVNIDVPALGDLYNPKISVSSGQVYDSKQSNKKFRIVPTGRTCVVSVASITGGKTMKIGDVNYKVINPPKPTIEMIINGKRYNGASMVPKASRIQVLLKPDEEFKSALPQDARYGISSVEVLAQLSLGPPTRVNVVRTADQDATKPINIPTGTQVRQARPGTKIYVRINDIFRRNFRNKNIKDSRFSEIERTLSLVVR